MCSVAPGDKKDGKEGWKNVIRKYNLKKIQNLQRQTLHVQGRPRKDEHLSKVTLSYRPVLVSVKTVMMISLENRKVLLSKNQDINKKTQCVEK